MTPRLFSRREDLDDAVRSADRFARYGELRAIVAAGGDGTLIDVINRHPHVPICPFPLGTENLVARWLRIPRCGTTVARIIAKGQRQKFDRAKLNEQYFLIMASVGLDASIVHAVHARRQGGHVRHLSYVLPVLKALVNNRPPTLRIYVDDASIPVEGEWAVIANLPAYALQLPIVPTACGTDGWLDLRMFRIRNRLDWFRHLLAILSGDHERSPEVVRLRGRRFRIESESPVAVQADGDPYGMTPGLLEIEPLSVELLVPSPEHGT